MVGTSNFEACIYIFRILWSHSVRGGAKAT